jgi:hypothetical protein
MVGVIGGILDFASATTLLTSPAEPSTMGTTGASLNLPLILLLYLLGTAVILTSVLSIMSIGFRFGRWFSILMIVYGGVMMVLGWLMTAGSMQGTAEVALYGYGMLLVGALMLVNGGMMVRSPMAG